MLKKYANRRIYDTDASQFVKLNEIRQMVLDRKPFQVVDARSGNDLTRTILMQIITELEAEGHESLLTNRILEELIRFFDDKLIKVMSPYLEQQILQSLAIQDDLRDQLSKAFTPPGYVSGEQALKTMAEQYEAFARTLTGQAPDPTGAKGESGTDE